MSIPVFNRDNAHELVGKEFEKVIIEETVLTEQLALFPLSEMWWLSPEELHEQFEAARRGDVIVYGVGQLDYALDPKIAYKKKSELRATVDYTRELYAACQATLTQKRHGAGKSEYWLVKL